MAIKNGDAVLIITHNEYTNKAAKVINVENNTAVIKLWDGSDQFEIPLDNIKRKKSCVCGMSKSKPFCDGSHAGS
jgi:ribosome maturation factor RimP